MYSSLKFISRWKHCTPQEALDNLLRRETKHILANLSWNYIISQINGKQYKHFAGKLPTKKMMRERRKARLSGKKTLKSMVRT